MKKNTYEEHVKELLKNKNVRKEYEKLLPEYELGKEHHRTAAEEKDDPGAGGEKGRHAPVDDLHGSRASPTGCPNFRH